MELWLIEEEDAGHEVYGPTCMLVVVATEVTEVADKYKINVHTSPEPGSWVQKFWTIKSCPPNTEEVFVHLFTIHDGRLYKTSRNSWCVSEC